MNALSELWAKLAGSKEYRHALVASELKRGVPRQIRILRKQREWNQQRLAQEAGLTQGAISRAEDPDYGNLTLNNLLQIGSGLDVAFIGRFIPFSEFAKRQASLGHESQLQVPSFTDDVGLVERKEPASEGFLRQIPREDSTPILADIPKLQMSNVIPFPVHLTSETAYPPNLMVDARATHG
jgi:transcriptional regulator with XRE-family HTH domain